MWVIQNKKTKEIEVIATKFRDIKAMYVAFDKNKFEIIEKVEEKK